MRFTTIVLKADVDNLPLRDSTMGGVRQAAISIARHRATDLADDRRDAAAEPNAWQVEAYTEYSDTDLAAATITVFIP